MKNRQYLVLILVLCMAFAAGCGGQNTNKAGGAGDAGTSGNEAQTGEKSAGAESQYTEGEIIYSFSDKSDAYWNTKIYEDYDLTYLSMFKKDFLENVCRPFGDENTNKLKIPQSFSYTMDAEDGYFKVTINKDRIFYVKTALQLDPYEHLGDKQELYFIQAPYSIREVSLMICSDDMDDEYAYNTYEDDIADFKEDGKKYTEKVVNGWNTVYVEEQGNDGRPVYSVLCSIYLGTSNIVSAETTLNCDEAGVVEFIEKLTSNIQFEQVAEMTDGLLILDEDFMTQVALSDTITLDFKNSTFPSVLRRSYGREPSEYCTTVFAVPADLTFNGEQVWCMTFNEFPLVDKEKYYPEDSDSRKCVSYQYKGIDMILTFDTTELLSSLAADELPEWALSGIYFEAGDYVYQITDICMKVGEDAELFPETGDYEGLINTILDYYLVVS